MGNSGARLAHTVRAGAPPPAWLGRFLWGGPHTCWLEMGVGIKWAYLGMGASRGILGAQHGQLRCTPSPHSARWSAPARVARAVPMGRAAHLLAGDGSGHEMGLSCSGGLQGYARGPAWATELHA